jgi:hypothetical protein
MERAPQQSSKEVANTNETLKESIEHAHELYDSIKQFESREGDGNVISLDKAEWKEAGRLSVELKEVLKNIPAGDCLKESLPYHPTDEKFEQSSTEFPNSAESGYAHVLGYDHRSVVDTYPERYPTADELEKVS